MDAVVSRRHFLFRQPLPLRPPWALAEEKFLTTCNQCDDCIGACPEGILVARRGRPEVDFSRGECTFCGDCVQACRKGALQRVEGSPPWSLRAVVGQGCLVGKGVTCRACGDVCAPRAIRFPPLAEPQVTAGACTGCGACVSVCPVQAVVVQPGMEKRHAA